MSTCIKLVVISLFLLQYHVSAFPSKGSIEDVQLITFEADKQTSTALGQSVPQLTCVSADSDQDHSVCQSVRSVQCRPVSFDGPSKMKWICETSDLPQDYVIHKYSISCEWMDPVDDGYMVKGSCGLNFTVRSSESSAEAVRDPPSNPYDGLKWIMGVLFVLVVMYFCCRYCCGFFQGIELHHYGIAHENPIVEAIFGRPYNNEVGCIARGHNWCWNTINYYHPGQPGAPPGAI